MSTNELYLLISAVLAAVGLVVVMRVRVRGHAEENERLAGEVVCEHLRPAWELLAARGHRATRVGQKTPDLPMEIHVQPPFDPQALFAELKLAEPVFVSERQVIYCKEDWCEIHPTA